MAFTPKFVKSTLGDFEFAYIEKNEYNKDKVSIVYLPNHNCTKEQFIPQITNLPDDIHVVSMDMCAPGATPNPPDDVTLDLDFFINRAEDFLDALFGSKVKRPVAFRFLFMN